MTWSLCLDEGSQAYYSTCTSCSTSVLYYSAYFGIKTCPGGFFSSHFVLETIITLLLVLMFISKGLQSYHNQYTSFVQFR